MNMHRRQQIMMFRFEIKEKRNNENYIQSTFKEDKRKREVRRQKEKGDRERVKERDM